MPLFSGQREAPLVDANIFERELAELSQNAEVPTLSSKKAFEVKDMRLTPRDLQRLSSLLKTKYLTKLSLVGTQILPSGIKELAEGLKDAKNLSVLDLSDNPLGDQGIQTLSLVAKFMPGLREIHLRDTKFTAEGSNSLKELLKLNKRIHVLDLSYNYLGDEGVKKICQGILDTPLGDHSEMIKIMMKNCEVGNQGAQLIGSVLVHVRTLKELDLSGNHIGAEGAKCIAHGLMKKNLIQLIDGENNTSGEASHEFLLEGLEVLDLSDNSLGDDGVKAIAKRLPVNLSLRKLRLVNVGMEAEGLVALSNSLIEADCVNELYIGDNKVKAGSVSAPVLEMLSKTSCLTTLDLSKIQMSADDVKTLGAFLGENLRCRLQHLNLSNCGITDQGCVDVANGIKFNMDLKTLDVTSNPFGASGARSFAKIFRRSKNLEKFYITGHSRIGAEGENYLAECLKYNKKLEIRGATTELDYLSDFVHKGKAFVRNSDGELVGWSEESWNIVKRGCGQIIGTVIYNLNQSDFRTFKKNVLLKSRNVVNQDMFEYVLRHSEAPSMDVVSIFLNKCKIGLDDYCNSKASISMAKEKRMSDDITYRFVAKDCAKDTMVRELAKNNMLFLARYLTENGPAVHQTHEVTRTLAVDLVSDGKPKVFVQVYENELDFMREKESREAMAERLKAGGPFAIYDSILREKEVHEEHSVISFNISITDLRNSIANLGVTAGYDIHETVFLAKRAAQCLGTINNLGRIHGDFRPRNFHKVANKRMGDDPLGRSSKKMLLPDKWVLFDFSKSVPHGTSVALRAESSYIPPEVARVTFNANYQDKQLPLADESMDVWSFGVVLFQLLTGVHLFHVESNTDRIFRDKERMELMNWINLDETRAGLVLHRANESQFQNPSTFKKIKESAIDLLNWCLQGDPHNRPSFNDILTHPFFVYKTNVNYTDVDLLLGWYKSIGSDMAVAKHKNNRTHAHVINTTAAESSDVLKALNYYYKQAGCKVTSDGSDWKLDINVRKELVTKARCLVILMTKDVLWQPHIMQKLIWAIDSNETTSYVLLDISTGFTNAKKFDFDEFIDELEEKKSKSENLSRLLDSLTPVAHKLQLEHMGVGEGKFDEDDVESNKKWLKGFLQTEVKNFLLNMQDKVIPYRTRPFQGQAMANEILNRSGFYAPSSLKPFTLQDNNKEITVGDSGASDGDKKNPNQKAAQVLILYNGSSGDDKIRNDALKLRSKLLGLENKDFKADAVVVGAPNEVYKYFKRGGSASPKLHAERVTLVLCIVSPGFYDSFREVVLHLNSATGMVSVVPIVYGEYDIKDKQAQNEVLNLGIENKAVLNKLKEQKYYIPLPSTGSITKSLEYEVVASLNYIKEEATKQMELAIKNEKKDANEVYSRYENTNFFKFVY